MKRTWSPACEVPRLVGLLESKDDPVTAHEALLRVLVVCHQGVLGTAVLRSWIMV